MENEKERTIEVLNTLVEINNDRIEGYETASEATEEQDLKTLFAQMTQTSLKCNQELGSEIYRLGGVPSESTRTTGKFFRVWMDVKAAITGKDRKSILASCEYGEDQALKTYEDVLEDDAEHLNLDQKMMIKGQHIAIQANHDRVKALRDALITTN